MDVTSVSSLSTMMVICIKQHLKQDDKDKKKIRNTEPGLKKSVAYKKSVYFNNFSTNIYLFRVAASV